VGKLRLMFTHELAKDLQLAEQRWLRVPLASRYSGISRATLYRLMSEGIIKSASLRGKGKARGIRVIDKISIDELLESLAGAPE
jgi:hypothetical protein